MNAPLVVVVVAAVFGSLVGSFLNVCILRWAADGSITNPPRSQCPQSGRQLTWHANIPVISWLLLRGRCAGCGKPISIQYPAIELATALVWACAFLWPAASLVTSLRLA